MLRIYVRVHYRLVHKCQTTSSEELIIYFIRNIVKWSFSKDIMQHSTLSTLPVTATSSAITALLICFQPESTRRNVIYVITLVLLFAINKEGDRNCFLRVAETKTTSNCLLHVEFCGLNCIQYSIIVCSSRSPYFTP
jgi:hypothetical protein